MSKLVFDSTEQLEVGLQIFAHFANGGHVSTSIAVIGSGPDRNNILALEVVLVSFVDKLVSSGNEVESVDVAELL